MRSVEWAHKTNDALKQEEKNPRLHTGENIFRELYSFKFQVILHLKLLYHTTVEWFGWEGTFGGHLAQPPAASRDIFIWIRVLTAPSSLVWDGSRDGASTTALGNPCQGLTSVPSSQGIPLYLGASFLTVGFCYTLYESFKFH